MSNQNRPDTPWPQRDEELRKHHAQHMTSGQIARAMRLTRNQVIGRLTRLGVSHSAEVNKANLAWSMKMSAAAQERSREGLKKANAARVAKALANPRPTRLNPPKPGPQNVPGAVFGKVEVVSAEETERRRNAQAEQGRKLLDAFAAPANDDAILLLERAFGQCSWPVGEPDRPANQMCCGQPVPEDANRGVATYCTGHALRAISRTRLGGAPDAKAYERSLRRVA